jgi:hypothetical protein
MSGLELSTHAIPPTVNGTNGLHAVPGDVREWLSFDDPVEERTWMFDVTFLTSRYTCIYGRGCQGVLTEAAPELEEGCCSYGAHFTDDEDRRRVEAAASRLTARQWQHRAKARRHGLIAKDKNGAVRTRLVAGACIFLNRPGFPGGAGCALHRAALDAGERPMDLKPEVCWQVPLRRIDLTDDLGHVTSTLREWKRRDWDEGGAEFHWWCTEAREAFVGADPVYVSLRDEIVGMIGQEVYDRLAAELANRSAGTPVAPPTVRRRV